MVKVDIADILADRVGGLTKAQSLDYVNLVFSEIKATLASGENVLISGFGKFSVRHKHKRFGRNPQTGERILLEARRVVTFTPSNTLRDKVNH